MAGSRKGYRSEEDGLEGLKTCRKQAIEPSAEEVPTLGLSDLSGCSVGHGVLETASELHKQAQYFLMKFAVIKSLFCLVQNTRSTTDLQIIAANPELGLYNSEGVIGGGRSALTLAAGIICCCVDARK